MDNLQAEQRMTILRFRMEQELRPYAIQFIDVFGEFLRKQRDYLGFFNFTDKKNLDKRMEDLLYARTNIYVALNDNSDILLPTENAYVFQEALLKILEFNKNKAFNLTEDEVSALYKLVEMKPRI